MSNPTALNRYKIGLGVIGFVALIFVIVVLAQASAAKQDNQTFSRASDIASQLNNYLSSNGTVPDNLGQAGIKNVPSSVSYQKLSDSSFKFCVDYKTTSTSFSSSSVVTNLVTSSTGFGSGGGSSDNTYLSIDSSHHKGENCQTINPYNLYSPIDSGASSNSNSSSSSSSNTNSSTNSNSSSTTDPYSVCDNIADNNAWQACIDKVSSSSGGTSH